MNKEFILNRDSDYYTRKDLIDYYERALLLGIKAKYFEFVYHYDIINDNLCLDKVLLKKQIKKVIIPKYFDCISGDAFEKCHQLIEIDAKYIKRIDKYGIYNCKSLKKIDLSSCIFFDTCSINYCDNLNLIKFSNNINTISENFIYLCNSIKVFNFGYVNNLSDKAFNSLRYYERKSKCIINAKYLSYLPYLYAQSFILNIGDCGFVNERYSKSFGNNYLLKYYKRELHFGAGEERFKSLLNSNKLTDDIKFIWGN